MIWRFSGSEVGFHRHSTGRNYISLHPISNEPVHFLDLESPWGEDIEIDADILCSLRNTNFLINVMPKDRQWIKVSSVNAYDCREDGLCLSLISWPDEFSDGGIVHHVDETFFEAISEDIRLCASSNGKMVFIIEFSLELSKWEASHSGADLKKVAEFFARRNTLITTADISFSVVSAGRANLMSDEEYLRAIRGIST